MSTTRRATTWYLWVPLVVLVVAALMVLAGKGLLASATGSGSDASATGTASSATAGAAHSTPPGSRTSTPRNTPTSGLATVDESTLPAQAKDTLRLIRGGGPFPYTQDNATFGNREGVLPARPRGYYREFTVKTPGSPDRGPRRLIAGRDGDLYWTTDHYATFRQVLEGR